MSEGKTVLLAAAAIFVIIVVADILVPDVPGPCETAQSWVDAYEDCIDDPSCQLTGTEYHDLEKTRQMMQRSCP